MAIMTTQVCEPTVTLPEGAPLVRITAGAGSAGQKTWNLRRPVTLIGSRRPAHIVLHDKNISPAHCVIVNTGTTVLIMDLHTSSGTNLNETMIDLTVLGDGDVIKVGSMNIQVAIQTPSNAPDDSSVGLEYENPTQFIKSVSVRLTGLNTRWNIEDAVVMIGRHENAFIKLDHQDVSTRHAILFRFMGFPAVFDLGGRNGLHVNEQPCSITSLYNDDTINVGPFSLNVSSPQSPESPQKTEANQSSAMPDKNYQQRMSELGKSLAPASEETTDTGTNNSSPFAAAVKKSKEEKEAKDHKLSEDISATWEKLNTWQSRLEKNATALNKQESNLATRTTDMEEKDAAIRGQLHDITRLQEEVQEAERRVEKENAQIQVDREAVAKAQKQRAEQEQEIKRKLAELQKRELAVSQQLLRLQNLSCDNCGTKIKVNKK